MKLEAAIHYTHIDLMPGVPLYVYALKGEHYSVLIDTGIQTMRQQVLELCKEVENLKYVLITHAHADHIGCNKAVRDATGASFAAAGSLAWIEDLEQHYQEFCIPSEHLPDSPEQRAEILGLMDGAVAVEIVLSEATAFRLGKLELTTLALPGHKLEEVGFLDSLGNLFMGDLFLALTAPFFHGFQTARGFHSSLNRVEAMIQAGQINRVLAGHYPPLRADEALSVIQKTRTFLSDVETATLDTANGVTFPVLWKEVCKRMNKQLEFRGFAMLQVQVKELITAGRLQQDKERISRV